MDQQSPIDLRDPIRTDYGPDQLHIDWTSNARGTIIKDPEKGVRIGFGAQQDQFITLDQKTFHLVEFHFHHASEHWIAGEQQLLELHVVHQNVDDGTRAVLGIFIDVDPKLAKASPDIRNVLKSIGQAPMGSSKPPHVISTNPRAYLPKDTKHYWRYEGSLTTPPYDENVSWVVFQDVKRFPKATVDEMIELFEHPARLPQGLARRFILSNF